MTEGAEQAVEAERAGEAVVAMTAEELAAVRELALRAHPDAVPELVVGGSVAEVMASLEGARAAYRRIAEAVGRTPTTGPGGGGAPPAVPAGDAPRVVVDVEALPTTEKIRRGLAGRGR